MVLSDPKPKVEPTYEVEVLYVHNAPQLFILFQAGCHVASPKAGAQNEDCRKGIRYLPLASDWRIYVWPYEVFMSSHELVVIGSENGGFLKSMALVLLTGSDRKCVAHFYECGHSEAIRGQLSLHLI